MVVGDQKKKDVSFLTTCASLYVVVCEEEKEGCSWLVCVVERWRLICVIDEKTTRDTLSLYRT